MTNARSGVLVPLSEQIQGVPTHAVMLVGKIASGKSTISRLLEEVRGFQALSFGKYVRWLAEARGLPVTRQSLQDLGAQEFAKLGPDRFLEETIKHISPTEPVHVFDGVRHVAMVAAIRRRYQESLVAFVESTDDLRYSRYLSRLRPDDPHITMKQFASVGAHEVEHEINQILTLADIVLDARKPSDSLAREIVCAVSLLHYSQ